MDIKYPNIAHGKWLVVVKKKKNQNSNKKNNNGQQIRANFGAKTKGPAISTPSSLQPVTTRLNINEESKFNVGTTEGIPNYSLSPSKNDTGRKFSFTMIHCQQGGIMASKFMKQVTGCVPL